MMDAAPNQRATRVLRDYRQRVTDGLNNTDRLVLHRPGFRAFPASDAVRARDNESRELDRLEYLDSKDAELRSPPTNTEPGWLKNSREQIVEGEKYTVRNLAFKQYVGSKGRIGWCNGELCCIPLALLGSTDAADAKMTDTELAHLEYKNYISNAWRGSDAKLPKKDPEEEEDDNDGDEDADEDDLGQGFEEGAIQQAYWGTSTHTESGSIRLFYDAHRRNHRLRRWCLLIALAFAHFPCLQAFCTASS